MKPLCVCFGGAFLGLLLASGALAQQLTPAWVEVGPGGVSIARVVVTTPSDCPSIAIDRTTRRMTERTPVPDGFHLVCQAAIPKRARSVRVNGRALVLPKADPSHLVAFGDTGCRIKGAAVQDCDDPALWPFAQVAASIAEEKPQLVIHAGDYLYREAPCPAASQAKCGGTPFGDNWDSWNTDFFAPAAKLLAAAPWIFTRGNHEDCDRSWRGWFYYLDPRPWTGACERYSAPYVVKLGSFQLVVLDSSAVNEDEANAEQVSAYAAQLAGLHVQNAWLVDHHPFWGFKEGPAARSTVSLSAPLQAAWQKTEPKGIDLILSGHVHLFELVSFDNGQPVQLVAGDGGTDLAAPLQTPASGTAVGSAMVVASSIRHQFGYTVLDKSGGAWQLTLKDRLQNALVKCVLLGSHATCAQPT